MRYNMQSRPAKLYKWFYGLTEEKLPQSFCTYGRNFIILVLTIIPFTIFCIPAIIWGKIAKNDDITAPEVRLFCSGLVYAIIIAVFCMILGLGLLLGVQYEPDSVYQDLAECGAIYGTALIVGGVIYFTRKLLKKRQSKPSVQPEPSIFIEYIKAKKQKICPRIEWYKK